MHRTLARAFAVCADKASARFLWRLEREEALATPRVLVQSASAADWSVLQALPGYLQSENPVEERQFELSAWLAACAARQVAVVRYGIDDIQKELEQFDELHRLR